MIYQFEACDKGNKKPKVSQSKETKKKMHIHGSQILFRKEIKIRN